MYNVAVENLKVGGTFWMYAIKFDLPNSFNQSLYYMHLSYDDMCKHMLSHARMIYADREPDAADPSSLNPAFT